MDNASSSEVATLTPSDEKLVGIRQALLEWYDVHQRELPWRGVDDPYATWVSEIMLQQTQVITVKDYYARWMARFPTIEALALAELDEVLAMWAGLGYYRRARFLHKGARFVMEELGGQMPMDVKGLRALPGVGAYTAGAIASIAYGQVAALVDGNVERILARLYAIEGDPKDSANQKQFWALAEQLVDVHRPGDFNQSMMELGATICMPKKPACLLCPVRQWCAAWALGDVLSYPSKVKRRAPRKAHAHVLVALSEDKSQVLVTQRPDEGLLAGMWEFVVIEDAAATAEVATGLADALALWTEQVSAGPIEPLGELEHVFTHIRLTMHVYVAYVHAQVISASAPRAARWVRLDELDALGLSGAQRKVERLALGGG